MANYKKVIDENFIKDLHFIKSQLITDPDDWGLFQSQIEVEMKKLDNDYLLHSKAVEFPPFSDFDYRKRYMHSFPEKVKKMRNMDPKSDYRIIFKVDESKKTIKYFSIGIRIKQTKPRHPNDVWSRLNHRVPPERVK